MFQLAGNGFATRGVAEKKEVVQKQEVAPPQKVVKNLSRFQSRSDLLPKPKAFVGAQAAPMSVSGISASISNANS
jgi:hypothetical protein